MSTRRKVGYFLAVAGGLCLLLAGLITAWPDRKPTDDSLTAKEAEAAKHPPGRDKFGEHPKGKGKGKGKNWD